MNAIFRKLDVNYDKLDQYNASVMVSEARWTIIIGETVHNRAKQECRAGQTGHVPRAPPPAKWSFATPPPLEKYVWQLTFHSIIYTSQGLTQS